MRYGVRNSAGKAAVRSRRAAILLIVVASVLGSAQTALAASPLAAVSAASPADRSASVARVAGQVRRERMRRALRRELRRDPRAVLKRSFLKRASHVNFKLPLTVRPRPGAAMEATLLSIRRPLDTVTYPVPVGAQTLPLTGQFAMEMEFGTSLGGFGSLPSRSGHYVSFASTGGLRFANFGDCVDPPPEPAFVETTPATNITMTSGALTWTLLNPFSGAAEGDLYVDLSLRSRVRRSTATCPIPGDVADFDLPAAPLGTEPWAQPVRIAWSGLFRIAPAFTDRGALRLGRITATEPAQPQPLTTGNIWACAASSVLMGPTVPPGNACQEVSAPLIPPMEAVGAAPFPAQLKVTSFDADVLIGDVPLPP